MFGNKLAYVPGQQHVGFATIAVDVDMKRSCLLSIASPAAVLPPIFTLSSNATGHCAKHPTAQGLQHALTPTEDSMMTVLSRPW